jgi:hypothetical protein
MSTIIESVLNLLTRLKEVQVNEETCIKLSRKYKLLVSNKHDSKIPEIAEKIRQVLPSILAKHKDLILNKDFSFLMDESFIIDDIDIAILYRKVLDSDNVNALKSVNNELLNLFYQVMSPEEKSVVDGKFKRKKSKKPKNETKDLVDTVQGIFLNQKDLIKKAESNDPEAIKDVITSILKNDGNTIADVMTSFIKNISGGNPRSK